MSLNLERLRNGVLGLSPEICSFYLQACTVCLESFEHTSGVILQSSNSESISLHWQKNKENVIGGWRDMQESTEYGATAIALLMAERCSGFSYVERAPKGLGFDYWLGENDSDIDIFKNKARLEISGILKETKTNTLKIRVTNKINQININKDTSLVAHVCVTVFNNPKVEYQIIP